MSGHLDDERSNEPLDVPGEASEADALEQARSWDEQGANDRPRLGPDDPEADVVEQARSAPLEDDDVRGE